jgi:hypothetical protein
MPSERTITFTLKLSPAEHKKALSKARAFGVTLATYLRLLMEGHVRAPGSAESQAPRPMATTNT